MTAACQVAEDAPFDDLDEGPQYRDTGGDGGNGAFDAAEQEKISTERESGVDTAKDNDLRGPDDEVGGIIGEVLASEAGKASGLIDGDNGDTKHVRSDWGRLLRWEHSVHRSYAECGAKRKVFCLPLLQSEQNGDRVDGKI